ncbi:hypothetical protein NUM3379_17890 [Kineococcus sp. NUM-3379]
MGGAQRPRPTRRAVLAAGVPCAGAALLGADDDPARPGPRIELGMIGPYEPGQPASLRAGGVRRALVELAWSSAQPRAGQWDWSYVDGVAQHAGRLREAGLTVALNTGTMDAPGWLLSRPGARFVDQDGRTYARFPVPNLVFGRQHRDVAEEYLQGLMARLGSGFDLVRTGGGPFGELSYPWARDRQGRYENAYWAFDAGAARENPVPGFVPGAGGVDERAAAFLDWYLDALVEFQNWQVAAVRGAGHRGDVAVLYPSYGMRPGDFEAAVATGLDGSSSPEVNGEVQRGYDFRRQIAALADERAVVYGTWGENPAVVAHLAELARSRGLRVMAETSGGNDVRSLRTGLRAAADNALSAYYLVRAPQFFGGERRFASWAQARTLLSQEWASDGTGR